MKLTALDTDATYDTLWKNFGRGPQIKKYIYSLISIFFPCKEQC